MTGILHRDGTAYRFENERDVETLISLLPGDGELAERVLAFEPGGCWCVYGEDKKAIKDENGQYLTVSLSREAILRYWKVVEHIDRDALDAYRDRPEPVYVGINAKGSTGEDCFAETD